MKFLVTITDVQSVHEASQWAYDGCYMLSILGYPPESGMGERSDDAPRTKKTDEQILGEVGEFLAKMGFEEPFTVEMRLRETLYV